MISVRQSVEIEYIIKMYGKVPKLSQFQQAVRSPVLKKKKITTMIVLRNEIF